MNIYVLSGDDTLYRKALTGQWHRLEDTGWSYVVYDDCLKQEAGPFWLQEGDCLYVDKRLVKVFRLFLDRGQLAVHVLGPDGKTLWYGEAYLRAYGMLFTDFET